MIHWDSLAITGLHITSQEAEQSLFMSRESQDQDNLRLLSALGNFLINKNLSSKLRNRRGRKEAKFPPEAKCKKLWQRSLLLLWPVGGAQRGNWHKMWTGSVITRIFGLMRIRHKHSYESGQNSRDNIEKVNTRAAFETLQELTYGETFHWARGWTHIVPAILTFPFHLYCKCHSESSSHKSQSWCTPGELMVRLSLPLHQSHSLPRGHAWSGVESPGWNVNREMLVMELQREEKCNTAAGK